MTTKIDLYKKKVINKNENLNKRRRSRKKDSPRMKNENDRAVEIVSVQK